MTPGTMALLLAALALVVIAYVVSCDHYDRDPHDGPWILAAAVLITSPWGVAAAPLSTVASAATVAPRHSAAQGEGGPCLLLPVPGMGARAEGNAARAAHAPATAGPGVPGGYGSPGATFGAV